jgi:hypothetical protein
VECHQLSNRDRMCNSELLEGGNDIVHGWGEEVRHRTRARRDAIATYTMMTKSGGGTSDSGETGTGGYGG